MFLRWFAVALALCLAAATVSCDSSDAVDKFATSAVTALQQGPRIFQDMNDSCVRTLESQRSFREFRSLNGDAVGQCKTLVHQRELLATSRVLSAYFSTLGELAAFGNPSPAAASDAKKEAAAVQGGPISTGHVEGGTSQVDNVSLSSAKEGVTGLAGFLDDAVVGGLKRRSLERAMARADQSVAAITQAVSDIVQNDYLNGLLEDERNKQAQRYTLFAASRSPDPTFSDLLALNAQWNELSARLHAKRIAAEAYIAALRQIRDGHSALVQQVKSHKLKSKHVEAAVGTYTQSLADLASEIQKGY